MKTTIAIALVCMAGCSKQDNSAAGGGKGARKLEYPVDVAPLTTRTVQYSVTAPGSIDAYQQVQITARVAGAVDKVAFVEGQQVTENQTLVQIEQDRYQIAVAQAQAALDKAIATDKANESALARRVSAQKDSPGLVAGEEIETKQAAVDTGKADIDTAKQNLRVAQLNLRDSSVKAPIAGIVQTRTVQTGQYLTAGAVLATILQRDPLLLRFQVAEADAPRLKTGMEATLVLRESPRQFTAKITLVGGAADPTTRLVPITAELDTTEHQYWLRPGAFCEVSVPIGDARQGIVVSSLAVQPTEKGNVVYVIDDKNIAHAHNVELGMHTPTGGVELTRGVNVGDLLAVRGIEPLSDGAPVKISSRTTLEAVDSAPPPDAGVPASPTSPIEPDKGSAASGSAAASPTENAAGGGEHHHGSGAGGGGGSAK